MLGRKRSKRYSYTSTAYTGVGSPPPNSYSANPAALAAASTVGMSRSDSMDSNLSAAAAATALYRHNSLTQGSLDHINALASSPSMTSNVSATGRGPRRSASMTVSTQRPQSFYSTGGRNRNPGGAGSTTSLSRSSSLSMRPNPAKPPQPSSYQSSTQKTYNSDRTQSLTTTTVRQLGSFELTTVKSVPLRRPPQASSSRALATSSPKNNTKLQPPRRGGAGSSSSPGYASSILSYDSDLNPVAEEPGDNSIDDRLLSVRPSHHYNSNQKHDPPSRSLSPIKSALKDSSRSGSMVSGSSQEAADLVRKRSSNRVSFTEHSADDYLQLAPVQQQQQTGEAQKKQAPTTSAARFAAAGNNTKPNQMTTSEASKKNQMANAAKAAFVKPQAPGGRQNQGKLSSAAASATAAANLHRSSSTGYTSAAFHNNNARASGVPGGAKQQKGVQDRDETGSDSGNSIYSDAFEDVGDNYQGLDSTLTAGQQQQQQHRKKKTGAAAAAARGASNNKTTVEPKRQSLRESVLGKKKAASSSREGEEPRGRKGPAAGFQGFHGSQGSPGSPVSPESPGIKSNSPKKTAIKNENSPTANERVHDWIGNGSETNAESSGDFASGLGPVPEPLTESEVLSKVVDKPRDANIEPNSLQKPEHTSRFAQDLSFEEEVEQELNKSQRGAVVDDDDAKSDSSWAQERQERRLNGGGGFSGFRQSLRQGDPSQDLNTAAGTNSANAYAPDATANASEVLDQPKQMTAKEMAIEMMKNQRVGGVGVLGAAVDDADLKRSSSFDRRGSDSRKGFAFKSMRDEAVVTGSNRTSEQLRPSTSDNDYFDHETTTKFKSRFEDSDSDDDFALPPLPQSPLESPRQYLKSQEDSAAASGSGGGSPIGAKLKDAFSPNKEARFLIPRKKGHGGSSSAGPSSPSKKQSVKAMASLDEYTLRARMASGGEGGRTGIMTGGPSDHIAPMKKKKFRGLRKVFGLD